MRIVARRAVKTLSAPRSLNKYCGQLPFENDQRFAKIGRFRPYCGCLRVYVNRLKSIEIRISIIYANGANSAAQRIERTEWLSVFQEYIIILLS